MKPTTLLYPALLVIGFLAYSTFQRKTITDLEATINTLATQRDSVLIVLDSLKADVPKHYNHINHAETVLHDTTKLDFFKLQLRPE